MQHYIGRLLSLLCYLMISAVCLFASVTYANSTIDVYQFKMPEQESQFHELSQQIRCPKCQNNSIADSTAPLAQDLRQKVYEMIIEEKSNQEIIDYMVDRYGHFVTYTPPVKPSTIILWLGPLAFLLISLIFLILYTRTSRKKEKEELSEEEKERLNHLLEFEDVNK